ncbi:Uma2 family endonuclease [Cohnella sp. CFH 77786]|uniref:Uma2 family endonuclease n=1 Tax=Cohnella sp. CFH 77786 TaxID=2662265 RepID=UPI001C60DB37|nr:Uma2 family endonuclease [Cohnella sp. CFH 77786]MBW5447103.1 Uma2 family endonuclease [Cohnella sp. CFH 77786]
MSLVTKEKKPGIIRETPMTYGEYASLPEDGNRYELVDGFLELMSPSASTLHQLISHRIQFKLTQTCDRDNIILDAPIDLILSDREVRQPDLVVLHRSRLSLLTRRGIEGPPDLVAEILSPSSIRRDKVGKRNTYAKYGIPEYWIIDPASWTLEQYVLTDSGAYDLLDVFAGDEPVRSERLPCVSFTMEEVRTAIPDIRD